MDITVFLRIAFSVCLSFSVTSWGVASSMFIADYNRGSKSVRSELMNTPGRGILLHSPEKISTAPVGRLYLFRRVQNTPFSPVVQMCQLANKLQTAIIRIKKYRFMTLNDRHIKNTSFTLSPAHTALKRAARVIGIIAGLIVEVLLWAILKPVFRGVGWIISILTAIGIIYWITTL